MSKTVHTDSAPAAIGPYSKAVVTGSLVFTSGQIPIDPATGGVEADGIKAKYDNGVLTLTMPKRQETLPQGRTLARPPAFWPTWRISPPSTRSTAGTSPPSPPAAA